MSPSVKLLTEELAEVETGFQMEDILAMVKRLLLSFRHLAWALEQLENLIDWWHDLEPVLKVAVPHLIDKLDDLEQKGIFRINKAVINMYGKIAENYSPEDIDAMGDGFVRMHGIIKKLSEPAMIDFLEQFLQPALPDKPGGGQTHRPRGDDVQDDEPGLPPGTGRGRGDDPGSGENEAGGGGLKEICGQFSDKQISY